MDMNAILQMIGRMFPAVNLGQAVNKAQDALNGVPNTLDGVSQAASKIGIDRGWIENIYNRYGTTTQARAICNLMGTTPEALKADAEKIVGGGASPAPTARTAGPQNSGGTTKKFPRLK
jgi:hypothetical protein